jgi:hypothetical protein
MCHGMPNYFLTIARSDSYCCNSSYILYAPYPYLATDYGTQFSLFTRISNSWCCCTCSHSSLRQSVMHFATPPMQLMRFTYIAHFSPTLPSSELPSLSVVFSGCWPPAPRRPPTSWVYADTWRPMTACPV